jgi:hypothetical protein
MEAMSMGKLVVATGYSGNMTFMNEQNSMPVPYKLVEPALDRPFFLRSFAGPTASWAEPDINEAARLLRMARDPDLVARLGQQAYRDMSQRQETAWRADYLAQMSMRLRESDRYILRPGLRRQAIFQELWDSTLRRKNIDTMLKRRKH